MTSLTLLLWIVLGVAAQVAIYLAIGFSRHWQGYQALRNEAEDMNLPTTHAVVKQESVAPVQAAWSGLRSFKVERKVIEDAAQSICSFYLKPEDGQALPPYLPGQFLTFNLDIPNAAGSSEQLVRCYSLSDAPQADCYRVSIKRAVPPAGKSVPPGRSSNFFHDHVEVGCRLQVRAPAGHFHIDSSDAPVVLIGGGIGITPMLSMLKWCLDKQPGREVWLFYGVRNGRELAMKAQLENLAAAHANFHLRFCFSDPLPDDIQGHDYQQRGRVDVSLLRNQLPFKPFHFYICGPTPLMESLVPALEDWGVPDAHIHYEAFGPASIKRKQPATQSAPTASDITVTFAQSGQQFAWQPGGGTLLEFAEAHGIAASSGCRAGGCGSCQTTIRSGEVTYRQEPEYDPEPGTCLLCVCEPKTSVTLEV
ncbi:MAG: 2Fe-2S iron-sulfur cluster-binding protein [Sideroxydans sp.]|nr:2Fe-2S iron-sulfur cluster-binding protein [Sideroxydans sp.]